MKIIRLIGHPVIVIIVYLLLTIEGDNFGGYFAIYLMLALPHGAIYATIATIGIFCLIVGFNINKPIGRYWKPISYLVGFCLMIIALFIFFAMGNKWATFLPGIPLMTFILFGICGLCFLVNTFSLFALSLKDRKKLNVSSS